MIQKFHKSSLFILLLGSMEIVGNKQIMNRRNERVKYTSAKEIDVYFTGNMVNNYVHTILHCDGVTTKLLQKQKLPWQRCIF